LLDGVVMEKLGVPTAVVITEPFVGSASAMAVAHGMPGYPFAVIPHPIAATEVGVLKERADRAMDEVASILLDGGA
jgi:hypothetical protein